MSRVLVIGIDGMDWRVLEPLLPELPHLSRLAASGFGGELEAIFPPDSIPSWVSIFTGLDPSEHGVLESIDYFKKDVKRFAVDTAAFRGRTFWDRAGELGKRVIVVNPLLAYPPWPVRGVMASGPMFISGETAMEPPALRHRYEPPPLGGIVDFPDARELAAFAEKTKTETRGVADFTARLMRGEPWDLAFVTLLTLDRMFHFFWRYQDPDDPTHPRRSPHADALRGFHRVLDECVGTLVEAAGPGCVALVLSDHGHGRRATLHFNLNELLRRNGYLQSRIAGPRLLSPRYHIDRAKNIALETLHRLDLEDLSYRVAHLFPWTRKLKKGDFMTERAENLATASEFGGNNPFGGVEISKRRCAEEGRAYETIRDEIISLLLGARDDTGRAVFLWARRREELYGGPHVDRFPDVLYMMRPEFGTSWSIHRPLVTINPRHRKISGGHRPGGVLLAGPLDGWRLRRESISPLGVADTVLAVLSDGALPTPGQGGGSFLERH
jgi:predicted AlkP superfamily phosphohydrolase/phosphomutase